MAEKLSLALLLYLQYAGSLVFTESVTELVPAANAPNGIPFEMMGGASVTVTVTDFGVVPPGPVHEMLYVVVTIGETDSLSVTPVFAVHGEPLHETALEADHSSMAELPARIEEGDALREMEGGSGALTVRTFES